MPSGLSLGRYRLTSPSYPVIEIATYQQARSLPTDKSADIALISTPKKFFNERPYTAESDNRTVCVDPSEQPDATFRNKYFGGFGGTDNEGIQEFPAQRSINDLEQNEAGITSTSTRVLDMIVLPLTLLIYLSDYIQRSNIGNGAVYGLGYYVLDGKPLYYALVLSSFSITYLLFSIAANIVVPKLRSPTKLLSGAVLITSSASFAIGFSSNFGAVFICRSLIGIGGAVLGKSLEVYYSLMYTRDEMAKRMSFFIGSAVLAGALNGIIAYGTGFINSEIKTWRCLYFIEGGPGILLAIICLLCLPSPKNNSKVAVTSQVHLHTQESLTEINSFVLESKLIEWRVVLQTLCAPNTWVSSFSYGCINLSVGSLTGHLPLIVESIGYSPQEAQLLTALPYLVAFVVMFWVAHASDRSGIRSVFVIFMCIIGSVGWALLMRYDTKSIKYLATFLIVTGAYCPIPLLLSWTLSNCTSYSQRATSLIIMQTFGQSFTVSSNFIFYAVDEDRWHKKLGFLVNLVSNTSAMLAISYLTALYYYKNTRRNRGSALNGDFHKYFM